MFKRLIQITNLFLILSFLASSFLFIFNFNVHAADSDINTDIANAATNPNPVKPAQSYCDSGQALCKDVDRGQLYVSDNLKNRAIPTNRIWSSVVFLGKLTGLYSMPNVAKVDNNELKIGLPNYANQVGAKTFSGILDNSFGLSGENNLIDKVWVEDYSDLSVKLSFRNTQNQTVFLANFVQGSPYIFIESKVNRLSVNLGNYTVQSYQNQNFLDGGSHVFGLFGDLKLDKQVAKLNIDFNNSNSKFLTLGLANNKNQLSNLAQYAGNRIDGITANFGVNRTTVETSYNFNFASGIGNNTIFGLLPHQYNNAQNAYLYQLPTIRGQQNFQIYGSKVNVLTPKQPLLENLPILEISAIDKAKQIATLKLEAGSVNFDGATASYEGGKTLARAARLIQVADSLGETVTRDNLVKSLGLELSTWYKYTPGEDSKYFQFDKSVGTLIAQKDGYGSGSDINDHHFHYGYHIFAAAIVAKYDSSFLNQNKEFVNLIANDITNLDRSSKDSSFVRNYDFYEGHSWAAGTATFGDGNNQESSSEAVNAWYGIWLWGRVSSNQNLQNLGNFLYTNETNDANYYYLNNSSNKSIFPAGYQQNTAGILWGGKVDYGTFFSGDDLAINGIQYLPFSPGSIYLYNRNRLDRDFSKFGSLVQSRSDDWVDINSMYFSMNKGKGILDEAKLANIKIDGGNSKSNIYSWINFWDKSQGIARLVGTNYSGLLMVKNNKYYLIVDCDSDNAIKIGDKNCVKGVNVFENPNDDDTKILLMNQYMPTLTSDLWQIVQAQSRSLGR